METIVSIKPLLAVLVSSIGAIFILSAMTKPKLRESWYIISGVVTLLIVLSMIPEVVYNNTSIEYSLFTLGPGVEISCSVDGLGLLCGIGASLLWIASSFYSIGYSRTTN